MSDDADELGLVNLDVDVLDRDERPCLGREDLGQTCELERNDELYASLFDGPTKKGRAGLKAR